MDDAGDGILECTVPRENSGRDAFELSYIEVNRCGRDLTLGGSRRVTGCEL